MCVKCLQEAFPERERTALEAGHYLMNYAGCAQCKEGRSERLSVVKRVRSEEEDEEDGSYEETVEFEHACGKCGHVVASHYYCFRVRSDVGQQEYSMSCALCGKGEDIQSILPPSATAAASLSSSSSPAVPEPSQSGSATAAFSSLMSGLSIQVKTGHKSAAEEDEWE